MCEYKVYETVDFFEMMRRGLMAKCAVMRKYKKRDYEYIHRAEIFQGNFSYTQIAWI